jgi:hypothetical protein
MVAMNARRRGTPLTIVTAGFAADERHGICYATVGGGGRETLVRVEFACRPLPVLRGRDVAYYALDALAGELLRRGTGRVEIHVDDEYLPEDLKQRRALPSPLTVPYVALRCRLNRFDQATVRRADGVARDLTARAQAEVFLNVAA